MPQLSATLRAIAERMSALEDVVDGRSAPAEEVSQAIDDIFAMYGITGQIGEVMHTQREQIRVLTAAVTTLVEQGHRVVKEQRAIRALLERLLLVLSPAAPPRSQSKPTRRSAAASPASSIRRRPEDS